MKSIESADTPNVQYEISDPSVMAIAPVVSIQMSTYNHGPYLAEAIEGVIAQKTDFPIELVIGEDCSIDNTRDIALDYQRRYPQLIRVIYSDRNVGMITNGRRVRAACRGEFIAFCEGDDYWVDNLKLQKQVKILQDESDVGFVYGNFAVANLKNRKWVIDWTSAKHRFPDADELQGDIYKNCLDGRIRTLTTIYRRSILNNLYQKDIPFHEYPFGDNFIYTYASSISKVKRIEGIVAIYRCSLGSATRNSATSNLNFLLAIKRFIENLPIYFPEKGYAPNFDLLKFDITIAKAAFMAGNSDEFRLAVDRLRLNRILLPLSLHLAKIVEYFPFVKNKLVKMRLWLQVW